MSSLSEAVTKVVEVLSELNSDERARVVKASLTLLGDEFTAHSDSPKAIGAPRSEPRGGGDEEVGVHAIAQMWMRKNSISIEHLEHYFHFDQGRCVPIALPGNATSKREQTANAYLTQGLASYLISGDASFSDADARNFCEQSGCYDKANHAVAVKNLGNRVTGSKASGFKLTAPGLNFIADLVKQPKS